jgi:CHAD domain-containing protein
VAKAKQITKPNCHDAAAKVIQQILLARMKKMCGLRDQALDWSDPEGVHRMRVASRRLRSTLSDFKPYLLKGGIPLGRLKAIAKSLGAVRDEDVVLAALDELRSKANKKVAKGIEAIAEEHRRQRRQARTVLEHAIRPSTIAELRDDFRDRLNAATKFPDSAGEIGASQVLTFSQVGAKVIGDRLEQLIKASDSIYRPLRTKQLHKLRILAKRLRYAVELFAPCWGAEFKKSAEEIARFQTSLGELHDCDVWIANLGARLKKDSGSEKTAVLDRSRNDEAVVWLLHHFAGERTKHYRHALASWHKWAREGFLDRLKAKLNADFTIALPKSGSVSLNHPKPKVSPSSRPQSA